MKTFKKIKFEFRIVTRQNAVQKKEWFSYLNKKEKFFAILFILFELPIDNYYV